MKRMKNSALALAASLALLAFFPTIAPAQAPFYKGKTLTVVLGTDSAGATSVRLRTMSQSHWLSEKRLCPLA